MKKNYLRQSLELHLFFARIMKEHALFLQAGFTPASASWGREAARFQRAFETLLCRAVELGDGLVSRGAVESQSFITEFTEQVERQTERLTALPIDRGITAQEEKLRWGDACTTSALLRQVSRLNCWALELLDGFIDFQKDILEAVLRCRMFTMNYPLLLEHIIREADLYRQYLTQLEDKGELDRECICRIETFWNQIMMEHALFIRGLLDPTEKALIEQADDFAEAYEKLLEKSRHAQDEAMEQSEAHSHGAQQSGHSGHSQPGQPRPDDKCRHCKKDDGYGDQCDKHESKALEETLRFRDFKAAYIEGIADCKIRSIILPLLADHALREANHYIFLLRGED